MGEWRLEVDNLHKKFPGVYAVKGVSFQIAPGEATVENIARMKESCGIMEEKSGLNQFRIPSRKES